MTYRPMIIDGPAKRKKLVVGADRFVVEETKIDISRFWREELDPFEELDRQQTVYHIHKFSIGGRMFAVASVDPVQPPLDELIKVMLTTYAKQAEIK